VPRIQGSRQTLLTQQYNVFLVLNQPGKTGQPEHNFRIYLTGRAARTSHFSSTFDTAPYTINVVDQAHYFGNLSHKLCKEM
jgi:hypothetical protein